MKDFEIDMHDGYLHSNKEIVNELLTHIPEVAQARRASDSAIRDMDSFSITRNETLSLLATFDRNYGRFVDGTLQRLYVDELYAKVSTNLSLSRIDGISVVKKEELFKIIKLTDLATKEKGSVSLFINGFKVPDALIYVYMTESQTDILFPRIYLKVDDANSFFIEKRMYPKFQYINKYFPKVEGRTCQLTLTNEELTKSKIVDTTVVVYNSGRLMMSQFNVTKLNNTITVQFENDQEGSSIEIIVDSSIKSKKLYVTPNTSRIASWYIPEIEDKIGLIHGPVSKASCYFYIDGLRIPNSKIKQVGRLNFIYEELSFNPAARNCMCYFTDRDLTIIDTKFTIYGDDYYYANMIGPENVTKIFTGEYSNEFFNGINHHKILNDNSKLYENDSAKAVYNIIDIFRYPDDQTQQLINLRPSLARDFLNCFAKKDLYKTINHNGESFHTVSFNTDKGNDYEYLYIVDIDGYHVPDYELTIIDQEIREFVKIPGKFFKTGINKLHIIELKKRKNQGIVYKIYQPSDVRNHMGTYMITVPFLPPSIEPNDYLILEPSLDEPKYIYDTVLNNGEKIGWKINNNVQIYSNFDGTMNISFNELPTSEFCLYCKKFIFKFNYTVTENITSLNDVTIPIRSYTEDKVPIIANGKYHVYLNNRLLFEGLDYYIRHPGEYQYVTYTILCIRRHIKKGDSITVYFTDIKQEVVFTKEGVGYNKYGLLYFNQLKYPYSPEYIDLYIDGKLITKDKIEILSDKLIRVPEEVQPFRDVYAETNFRVDCDSFDYFLEGYKESEIDKHIKQYFLSSITMSPTSIDVGFYESLDDKVDNVLKLPNPYDKDIINIVRYDLLVNAYLLWLRSYSSKTIIKAHQEIDPNIVAYFKLYSNVSTGERKDIVISADRVSFFEPLVLGSRTYYNKKTEKLAKLLEWGKKSKVGSRDMLNVYTKDLKIANDLYPRDLPKNASAKSIVNRVKDICLGGRNHED